MTAISQTSCSLKYCQNQKPKRFRTIFVKNRGYFICEKCFDFFKKVGQLVIE